MTLSGTRCSGLKIRFLGAARPSSSVQANADGQLFGGRDVVHSGMGAPYVFAKFSSTPTPSGS
jgi:hypothetical protein